MRSKTGPGSSQVPVAVVPYRAKVSLHKGVASGETEQLPLQKTFLDKASRKQHTYP